MTVYTEQETSKTASNTQHQKSAGTHISPGPYVGIVKNVIDPLYSGKLQVYIPELGGDPTDKTSWKNMMYATPFYGRTNIQDGSSYAGSPHSYGMWFVPPDIDNKVLCMFVNGDPARGYWFACIPDWPALHMVPGIAAPVDNSNVAPVVDHYDSKDNPQGLSAVRGLDKFVHEDQRAIWDKQGLTQDLDRGPGRSSAQRETPSAVFGISTPGRPIQDDDPKLYPDNLGFTSGGTTQKTPGQLSGVYGRKGGHTFVMDDGDYQGNNQMFRLRSASGHMILMNDTKEFIYIINSKGTSWIEMTKEGAINIFAQSQMNITAKDGFSLETGGSLKLHGSTVDIVADNGLSLQGADVNVLASGSTKIAGKQSLHLHSKKNTYLTGEQCIQIKTDGHIDLKGACHTINTADANKATEASEAKKPDKMPTNEPWAGHGSASSPTSSPSYGSQNNQVKGTSGPYGATSNFGSGGAQQNYGNQTNNVPPVVYNNGPQGSTQGQASTAGSYSSPNNNGGGVNWTVAGAIAGAVAGIAFSGSGGYSVSGNASDKPDYSVGELQNNPGNLPYNSSDTFAVGYNNNLAVYAKPEDGIAALALVFDALNVSTSTRCIDLIQNFLNAKSNQDPKVIDMTRYIQVNLAIVADDYVVLTNPTTRIGWIANVIKYLQGRIIYTYDQVVSGCAASLKLDVTSFSAGIQPVTKPWQNNNGSNPFSGFVNPAKNTNVVQNGSSPLQTIGSALIGGLLGGAVGSAVQNYQRSNQPNVIQVNDINAANRYLQSNPNTPSGTVFQYPDGSSFTVGGGSVTFADGTSGTSAVSSAVGNAAGASVEFTGIINNGTQGSGGCATLAQTYAPNLGLTKTWSGGDPLSNGTAQAGDVYATFAPNGQYTGQSGVCHTVIFNNYTYDSNGNINGAYVTEQYSGQPPHTAFYSASQNDKYETFSNMQRVQSDTAPSGANVTQTQQYTNVDAAKAASDYAASGSPLPPERPADLNATDTETGRDMSVTKTGSSTMPVSNPNDANGGLSATAQPMNPNDGYTPPNAASAVSGSNTMPITNPNDASGSVPQITTIPGLTRTYDPVSGTYNYVGTTSDGQTVSIRQNTVDSLAAQGQTPDTLSTLGADGLYSVQQTNDANSSATAPNQPATVVSDIPPTTDFYPVGYEANQANRGIPASAFSTTNDRDSATPYSASQDPSNTELISARAAANENNVAQYDPTNDNNNTELLSARAAANESSNVTVNGVRPQYDPTTGQVTNQPITGSNSAPGTGGTNGGQTTPQGSNNTGAGGKSC
jgi:Type VI secretion system/phage-baseplate injector OB domain